MKLNNEKILNLEKYVKRIDNENKELVDLITILVSKET